MNEVIRSRSLITCVREDAVDLGRVLEPPSRIEIRICLEEPLDWAASSKWAKAGGPLQSLHIHV